MKISIKLIGTFLVVAGIGGLIGYIGFNGMTQILESFDVIADETIPELIILGKIETTSQKLQAEALSVVIIYSTTKHDVDSVKELNEFEQTNQKLDQEITNLKNLDLDEFADDEEFIKNIKALKINLYNSAQNLINATYENMDSQTIIALKEQLEESEDEFEQLIQTRIKQETQELEDRDAVAGSIAQESLNLILVISITGITLAIVLGIIVAKTISNPLKKLQNASKQVYEGRYNEKLNPMGDHEIKNIIKAFNFMVESLEKQQEKMLRDEKLYTIGKLASRLSHDIRNPLTVIKGTIDIMKATSTSPDTKTIEYFDRMNESVARINHQVENVLDYIQQKPLKLNKVSLYDIIISVLEDIEIPENISVEKPEKGVEIMCDSNMLRVVFINLFMNAIQAIKKNNGTIKIHISEKDENNVIIEIEDSGPDIPDDVVPHIFEPLYTTKQEGTGLGLASCKNILEQHGGTIQLKTKPTTFTITLPKMPEN